MDDFFVRNRLSAYLDGELPAAEARAVESALARDPALRQEYEQLRRAVDLLRTHGPMHAPAGFELRLNQRLASEPMPVGWRRWTRAVRPEVLALGALAAAAIFYVGYSHDGGDGPIAEVAVPVPDALQPGGERAAADDVEGVGAGEDAEAVAAGEAPTGVLGDEGFAAAQRDAAEKRAAGPPPGAVVGGRPTGKSTGGKGVEREAYVPDWDVDEGFTVIRGDQIVQEAKPTAEATKVPDSSAKKVASAVPASSKAAPSKADGSKLGESQAPGAPPPFRYRVRSSDETMLSQLASIAASLGGRLVDSQGRAVVIHMLETGEVRGVRVVLPAGRVDALASKLRTLGDTEIMASGAAGASGDVTVLVELERE